MLETDSRRSTKYSVYDDTAAAAADSDLATYPVIQHNTASDHRIRAT
jgi:hypothetical protein